LTHDTPESHPGPLNLCSYKIRNQEMDHGTLSGLVEDDFHQELDQTGQGKHSLPCVASFKGSEDREIDEKDIHEHHTHPAQSFDITREDMRVTETRTRQRE
jgi:hypothetical protein